ncbi:rod shape-determining protein MreD [Kyrpidia tusciae]|uniref:Rod shape-determining protein MreD n=1 Tax=Kyrpidia tusciae (strain DSM 2912 / NBRC 15312 / T2) TaxID=562970 RepID=D5WUP5_KYRT2|nr:rod shape-determining protein MreD [Kyrpidia tusciae]ADG05435.1 rod shape-determining protein MreD [Kyrpidia tusciae DSM 2912]
MRVGWLVALLVAVFVFRSTILQALGLQGAYLNVDIVLLAVAAVLRGPWEAAGLAALIGFLEDVTFGRWLGLHALWLATVIFALGWAVRPLFRKTLFIHVLVVVLATGVYEGGLYLFGRLLGDWPLEPVIVEKRLLLAMFWNGLIVFLGFPLWSRLMRPSREDFLQSTPK